MTDVIILVFICLLIFFVAMLAKKTVEAKKFGKDLCLEKERRIKADLTTRILREEIHDRRSCYPPNQFGKDDLETLRILLSNGTYSRRLKGAAAIMLKKVGALLKEM